MCGIYTDKNIILTVHNFQCDCARLFQPERYPHILWRKISSEKLEVYNF